MSPSRSQYLEKNSLKLEKSAKRCGVRSQEKRQQRSARHVLTHGCAVKRATIAKHTSTVNTPSHPDHFTKIRSHGKLVTQVVNQLYPKYSSAQLERAPDKGTLVYSVPQSLLEQDHTHPPHYLVRFDRAIGADIVERLKLAWCKVKEANVRFPRPDANRSTSPALHLGVWHINQSQPILTGATRNQPIEAIKAIDHMLNIISRDVAPIVARYLVEYFPYQHHRLQKAHQWIRDHFLGDSRYDSVDFKGAFFTVAVKEGSSEIVHLDWNDDLRMVSWVLPIGDWVEGGEFCAPQLGIKVPVKEGQLLAAMTRLLAHSGTSASGGQRLVFTLFADHTLLLNSDK